MRKLTAKQIRNVIPTFSKLVACTSIATALVTCKDTGLATKLTELIDLNRKEDLEKSLDFIEHSAGVVAGIATADLLGYIKKIGDKINYGLNGDLEKILKEAIKISIPELENELIEYYKENDKEVLEALQNLFRRIDSININTLVFSHQQIENLVVQNHLFFSDILRKPFEAWDITYNKPETFPEDFESVVSCGFAIVLTKHLHELLKDDENERGRISYFTFLLELNAKSGFKTTKQLEIILNYLTDLEKLSTDFKTINLEITNSLKSVKNILFSLNQKLDEVKQEILDELRQKRQPFLEVSEKENNDQYDFRYKSQYTTFTGREKILRQILEFTFEQNRPFSWWMIVGPGGIGKSRTALEICLQLRQYKYYSGFLNRKDFPPLDFWSHWEPIKHTFLVFDYAFSNIDYISQVIHSIKYQSKHYNFQVRILLVDRIIQEDWWHKFLIEAAVENTFYVGKPTQDKVLKLEPLDEEAHWSIILEINKYKRINYSKEELLKILNEIDPERRPLFTFFIGVALADGDDIRKWNKYQLLDKLLTREEERIWGRSIINPIIYQKYKNLLALATLTRGVPKLLLDEIVENKKLQWLPSENEHDEGIYLRMITIFNDFFENKDVLIEYVRGLEPDILGEFFVLKVLQEIRGKRAVELIQLAWDIAPSEMILMTKMTLTDFTNFSNTQGYNSLLNTTPSFESSILPWYCWIMLCRDFCTNGSPSIGNIDDFSYWYKRIFIAPKEFFYNESQVLRTDSWPILIQEKIRALSNLTSWVVEPRITQKAEWILNEMYQFESFYDNELSINIFHQKAVVIRALCYMYGKAKLFKEAELLFEEFNHLLPTVNVKVLEEQAIAFFDFITQRIEEKQIDEAVVSLQLFDRLNVIDNEKVLIRKAMSLRNIIHYYVINDELNKAKKIFEVFETLNPKMYSKVNIEKAYSIMNISSGLDDQNVVKMHRWVLEALESLNSKDDKEIAEIKARTFSNLVQKWLKIGNIFAVKDLLKEFDYINHFKSILIDAEKARSIFNLGRYYVTKGLISEVKSLIGEFESLQPSSNEIVAKKKAEYLINLAGILETSNLLLESKWIIEEFDKLHPYVYESTAVLKSKLLFNIGQRFNQTGNLLESEKLIKEYDRLFPGINEEILTHKAMSIAQICLRYINVNQTFKVKNLLKIILNLRPFESDLILHQKLSVLNLILNEYKKSRLIEEFGWILENINSLNPKLYESISALKAAVLNAFILAYCELGEISKAENIMSEFSQFSSFQNELIASQQAQSLFNIITAFKSIEHEDENQSYDAVILKYLDELNMIYERWNDVTHIAEFYQFAVVLYENYDPSQRVSYALTILRRIAIDREMNETNIWQSKHCFEVVLRLHRLYPNQFYASILEAHILNPNVESIAESKNKSFSALQLIRFSIESLLDNTMEVNVVGQNVSLAYQALKSLFLQFPQFGEIKTNFDEAESLLERAGLLKYLL